MATTLNAKVNVTDWEEVTIDEAAGAPKITHATANTTYSGDFEGSGRVLYAMTYLATGNVPFVGYERFTGRAGAREGSFVLEYSGEYSAAGLSAVASIVTDSASGDFATLIATGAFTWPSGAETGSLQLTIESSSNDS